MGSNEDRPSPLAAPASAAAPEARSGARRVDLVVLGITISVAAALAYVYYCQVDRPRFEPRLQLHEEIINRTAPSPYRYRVLVPFVGEALRRLFVHGLSEKEAFLLAYAVYDCAAIFFSLMLLFAYLRQWFSREQALIGVLFAAATMPMALRDHFYQPWSLLEAGFFAAGFLCIYRKRHWPLAFVVLFASINRETALFIPLSFLLVNVHPKSKGGIGRTSAVFFAGYLGIWAIVCIGLRYVLGAAPPIETIRGLFSRNLTSPALFHTVMQVGLFFGAFWLFAVAGLRHAPEFIRRTTLIVPLYLVAVFLWGVWYEVWLFMPLYPVIIPLGLSFIYHRRECMSSAP